ncbi:MAG: PAS domain-containing protein [Desulfobacterales bacterium]|nr:PAS domain-containing protein [Desulfobacterales bacterium]
MATSKIKHRLQLNVAVVASNGDQCQKTCGILDRISSGHIHLKVVCLFVSSPSEACQSQAKERGIKIFSDYHSLYTYPSLDLILEMSGNVDLLSDLALKKPKSIGLLDQQAAGLFLDSLRQTKERPQDQKLEIGMAASFASTLLESSPDAVIIIDCDYRIINCNKNTEQLNQGQPCSELIGKYCFDALYSNNQRCEGHSRHCPMDEAKRTGRPARAVHEVRAKDGTPRINQVTTYPIVNHFGDIIQFVDVIRDITEDVSVRIEARAQAIKDDLNRFVQEDRLVTLGRLVASVCHEINNPITSIVTFNKLILSHLIDDTLPPEGMTAFKRYLDLSVREALRCGKIVNNLLTFARQKGLDSGPVDLIEMINTILVLLGHQIEKASIKPQLTLPGPTFKAFGDYAQIQQCLMNLILNAIEAMPQGGRLSIAGGTTDSHIWITVHDTGIGIEQEDLQRIFEPFYSTKAEGKGVGLGLSMVYGITREHGGTVVVDSTPGKGTSFKITLPPSPPDNEIQKGDRP